MTDRATAAAVGTLFLVAWIAGAIGLWLEESVVGGDDYLTAASAHPDRLATSVLLQLVMGVADRVPGPVPLGLDQLAERRVRGSVLRGDVLLAYGDQGERASRPDDADHG